MSPLELSILLHYKGCATDFRGGDFSAPAVREAIDWFRGEAGLLVSTAGESAPRAAYRLTERGEFFVNFICTLPLPESHWAMRLGS